MGSLIGSLERTRLSILTGFNLNLKNFSLIRIRIKNKNLLNYNYTYTELTDTHRGSAEDGRERVVYKVDVVE